MAVLSEVRLEKSVLKKFIGEESGNKCVQVIGHYTVIVLLKGGKNKVPKNTSLYAMLLTMILTASDISRWRFVVPSLGHAAEPEKNTVIDNEASYQW